MDSGTSSGHSFVNHEQTSDRQVDAAGSHQPLLTSHAIPRKPLPDAARHYVVATKDQSLPPNNKLKSSDYPRHSSPSLLHNWWLEISCCILATAMLFAVVAIVYPRQGLPLPQWPYSISVNSLIAVLTVIMKAAVLLVTAEGLSQLKWQWFGRERPLVDLVTYDKASRGPWGSLELMLKLRHHHIVTSIGAFVTVMALAIDPVTQQILRYYSCSILNDGVNATIPRTSAYDTVGVRIITVLNTLDIGMQSAINSGLYNPTMSKDVSFNCPTGNCTFPSTYRSVGYCSKCTNITEQIVVSGQRW